MNYVRRIDPLYRLAHSTGQEVQLARWQVEVGCALDGDANEEAIRFFDFDCGVRKKTRAS